MEEVIGSLIIDYRDKEWLRLGKREKEHPIPVSYVDIRIDGSEMTIHGPYGHSHLKKDPTEYQDLIEKTGKKSPQELVESSKRVYEKLKTGNYEDYDHRVQTIGVPAAAALIAGGGLMEYLAFNPLPPSILSAIAGGLCAAYGAVSLRKFMKHIKSFNKEEVEKILKEEGISYKKILRYHKEDPYTYELKIKI